MIKQREREACANVPEDVPQGKNVVQKGSGESRELVPKAGRGRMHARSNAKAQGPEHDGAHLEQVTCLRNRERESSDVFPAASRRHAKPQAKYAAQRRRALR